MILWFTNLSMDCSRSCWRVSIGVGGDGAGGLLLASARKGM